MQCVNGSFFVTGLAYDRFSPSSTVFTNGFEDGEAKPALAWTH